MNLDRGRIQLKARLFVSQESLHVLALVALQLDNIAQITVMDSRSVARKLFLDDVEYLLLGKLGRNALNRGQRLATVALLDPDVDVIFAMNLFAMNILCLGKGLNGLEVFNRHGL